MKNTNSLPPSSETNLNLLHLRVKMNELKAKYTDDQLKKPNFSTCEIGMLKQCKLYISDANMRGMAFCVAYKDASQTTKNKELCTSVGSMLCDVYPTLRTSFEAAFKGIGVKPLLVSLPSQAGAHNIPLKVPDMDSPSILVYFGCCIILLFKNFTDAENYNTFMSQCIGDLRVRAGCDPTIKLKFPFDFNKANAIRTMLGASATLRSHLIQYLIQATNLADTGIGGVCQYLCNVLAWSDVSHFTLINDLLVKPQSPVLLDPRVSREVDDLNDACEAITAHPNPQFFMHLAPKLELLKVEPSRFPTLIAVAQELKRANYSSTVADASFEEISTAGANVAAVYSLLKLHRQAMPQN